MKILTKEDNGNVPVTGCTDFVAEPNILLCNKQTGNENSSGNKNVVLSDGSEHQINPEVLGLKILLAEDDDACARIITQAIKVISKEIIRVTNGVEAVEACRNNADLDLVLMDIQMPEMDGYEATRQIWQFNNNVVIIAQTAYVTPNNLENTIMAGCNDYIAKPIKRDKLLELMQKYFNKYENENYNRQ